MTRRALTDQIDQRLVSFEKLGNIIPILQSRANRESFIEQVVDSIHRVKYIETMKFRLLTPQRLNPQDDLFDPLLAAIILQKSGQTEEACWLVFLATHFGKHHVGGWRYVREVYGRLGQGGVWDWLTVAHHPRALAAWLGDYHAELTRPGTSFGNHRKYVSFALSGDIVDSYVRWIEPYGSHQALFDAALRDAGGQAAAAFDLLYKSMNEVQQFGRLGKFDYLTMLGKIGLAPISPNSAYMDGATGPLIGAQLLFGALGSRREYDQHLIALAQALGIGMQEIEDAVCNWQKSPAEFRPFRG